MASRAHFRDLNRRYSETDWVSEYQRLWAIFNYWYRAHFGCSNDRVCIESLKIDTKTSNWVQRVIDESRITRLQSVSDGLAGSLSRYYADNVISRLFRETRKSQIIEPRINYPWRLGIDSRVRSITALTVDEDKFIKAYRAHGVILQDNITFDLTFHETLELIGIYSTGCCFYRDNPAISASGNYAIQLIDKFRNVPELHELVSLYSSHPPTLIHADIIEMLYNVRNTAMHGDLDFLIESGNSAARAACEALDSLLRDIRDNW